MGIKLLLTGGTIDKTYHESSGELDFVESHISELLELGRNHSVLEIEQLMLKDSQEMGDADRQMILKACERTKQDKILIIHGTDGMVDSAKLLGNQNIDKTIVLVGAMVPFVFKHSDAMFNVGFALAAVQILPHGAYIAMNGKVFDWDKVVKNTRQGFFVSI